MKRSFELFEEFSDAVIVEAGPMSHPPGLDAEGWRIFPGARRGESGPQELVDDLFERPATLPHCGL
jgi:hypothetical protein